MNKKFKIVSALAIIFALSTVVLASARLVNIKVAYDNIKVVVDGKEVQFGVDSTGKKIEPFIYNGTTYLPIRAVGEALGKQVQWDQNTKTAFLGDGQVITGESQKVLTEVMPPFTKSRVTVTTKNDTRNEIDLAGKIYNNGISFEAGRVGSTGYANFNLEGKYTNLTGLLGLDEAEHEVKVDFVGDGKLLKSFTIIGGQLPVDVNLDVTGVRLLEMKFEKTGGARNYYNHTNFVDIMVK